MRCRKCFKAALVFALFLTLFKIYQSLYSAISGNVFTIIDYDALTIASKQQHYKNHEWMLNHNVMQYSSYIKAYAEYFQIEAYLHPNVRYLELLEDETFSCVVKLFYTKNHRKLEETIRLRTIERPKFPDKISKKFIFQFKSSFFKSVNSSSSFNVNNIVVAVIRDADYDESLDDSVMSKIKKPMVLPYSMINYQIPTILHTRVPKIPSVGLCVHYTYNQPTHLVNWVQMQLDFGVAEIVFYDATDDRELSKTLDENFWRKEDTLVVYPFDINESDLCSMQKLVKQCKYLSADGTECLENVLQFLRETCVEFYNEEFKKKFEWRYKHEQLTVNDCYTILSQKYEYVAHYDIDEFVFPRSFRRNQIYEQRDEYECKKVKKVKKVCTSSMQPFRVQAEQEYNKRHNHLYNYIKSIISNYEGKDDIGRIRSIYFSHSFYLEPEFIHSTKLMENLENVINSFKKVPKEEYQVLIGRSSNSSTGHAFSIKQNNQDDYDHLKFIHKFYSTFFKCANDEFIEKMKDFDKTLLRFLVCITEAEENGHLGKAIHDTRYVKLIFTHAAEEFHANTWVLKPDPLDGHLISHFRENSFEKYKKVHVGPINKLVIDFEYLFYILKNYAKYCE